MDLSQFTPAAVLARKLVAQREKYLADFNTLYLGDIQLRSTVQWQKRGKGSILTSSRIVDEAEAEAIKADLPPDVELKHCSVDLPTGSLPPEEPSNLAHKYEVTEPAILTTVVRLHNDDFFFTSDANYRGPTQFTPNLGKVRATCLGGNPQLGPFEDDYSTVIENLEWLQEQIAHPELQERKGLLFPGPPRIKVRHLLFETKAADHNDSDADTLAPEFRIDAWPTHSEEAARELEQLKHTHDVIPIPAYNKDGTLINPNNYRKALQGAVVEVRFGLRYYAITPGSKSSRMPVTAHSNAFNSFTADLVDMMVLVPPTASPAFSSPRKRKVSMLHPSSPSKKHARTVS
ncbi:hypothetical protein EYR40_006148 [Pleurotus pulmonarius]|nr:hypothetical protein EYR36_010771 [Pleurotus pulmonarius]KAF4599059.1 hypothetical protein EYR40_006148 [Pleurotus pulmonarius]